MKNRKKIFTNQAVQLDWAAHKSSLQGGGISISIKVAPYQTPPSGPKTFFEKRVFWDRPKNVLVSVQGNSSEIPPEKSGVNKLLPLEGRFYANATTPLRGDRSGVPPCAWDGNM